MKNLFKKQQYTEGNVATKVIDFGDYKINEVDTDGQLIDDEAGYGELRNIEDADNEDFVIIDLTEDDDEPATSTTEPADDEFFAQFYYDLSREYARQAKEAEDEARRLAGVQAYGEQKVKALRRKRTWYKNHAPHLSIGFGAFGFGLGMFVAVSELLEDHGPTVTVVGTIGACAIYLGTALFFGVIFGWLGHLSAAWSYDDLAEEISLYRHGAKMAGRDAYRHLEKSQKYWERSNMELESAYAHVKRN